MYPSQVVDVKVNQVQEDSVGRICKVAILYIDLTNELLVSDLANLCDVRICG